MFSYLLEQIDSSVVEKKAVGVNSTPIQLTIKLSEALCEML